MATYRFFLVGKTEYYHRHEYTLQGDYNHGDALAFARVLCDAHRSVSSFDTAFDYCLCVRADGPLSASNDISVYHRPIEGQALTGARNVETFNQFTGLLVGKDTGAGRAPADFIPDVLSRRDMTRFNDGKRLSIDPLSPLWKVSVPYYKRAMQFIPDVNNVAVAEDGTTEETGVVDDLFHVNSATYMEKSHNAARRVPDDAREWQSIIAYHCSIARQATMDYTLIMDSFNHRWGDNFIPGGAFWFELFEAALTLSDVWYPLALALGWNIPSPNDAPGQFWQYRVVGGGPLHGDTYGEFYPTQNVSPFPDTLTLDPDCLPIVQSCISVLFNAQRNIQDIGDKIALAWYRRPVAPRLDFALESYIAEWTCADYSGGNPFPPTFQVHQDPNPSGNGIACVLFQSKEHRQSLAYQEFYSRYSGEFGRTVYEQWDRFSYHLYAARNALHLLLAFMKPKAQSKKAYDKANGSYGDYLMELDEGMIDLFPYEAPQPEDYELNGDACDWIETRAQDAAPLLTLSIPNQHPTIVKRLPRNPTFQRPPIWDNAIYASDPAAAFQIALTEMLAGRKAQAIIWWSERNQAWRVGGSPNNSEAYEPPIPAQLP